MQVFSYRNEGDPYNAIDQIAKKHFGLPNHFDIEFAGSGPDVDHVRR